MMKQFAVNDCQNGSFCVDGVARDKFSLLAMFGFIEPPKNVTSFDLVAVLDQNGLSLRLSLSFSLRVLPAMSVCLMRVKLALSQAY